MKFIIIQWATIVSFWVIAILTGCRSGAIDHPTFCALRGTSYSVEEEFVTLAMITYDQWPIYAAIYGITLPPRPPQGSIVGGIRSEGARCECILSADASKSRQSNPPPQCEQQYEQQYEQTLYRDDFWKNGAVPQYTGFELVRQTKEVHGAAARLICTFVYSQHDPRICLIRPVYLQIRAAKVKPVSTQEVNVKVNVVLKGAWISADGRLVNETLANETFSLGRYDLSERKELIGTFDEASQSWVGRLADHGSDYVVAPRPSGDRIVAAESAFAEAERGSGDTHGGATSMNELDQARNALDAAYAGGAFKLSVIITEGDAPIMRCGSCQAQHCCR